MIVGCMLLLLLLSACWDQRLLRDHSLILAIGYDLEETGKLLKTVSFPKSSDATNAQNGQASVNDGSEVVSTIGNTVKDAEKKLDKVIPERFDRSKARVIFFGEELAEKGIFSALDSIYRDLRGPLNANVAIFAGKAQEAISVNKEEAILTSEQYAELMDSAEESGIIKNYSVQAACPLILSQGSDLVLPYLSIDDQENPSIEGLALFHDDQMTGTLDMNETIVFLMLSNQLTKNASINLKVSDTNEDPFKNFINISIRSDKQKLNVYTKGKQIESTVHIDLKVEIDEFAEDHLDEKGRIKKLEKSIEKSLEQQANGIIKKMQEANNDSLGIGEKVRAYHHDVWKDIDWAETYPDISILPTFNITIIHHGIIN